MAGVSVTRVFLVLLLFGLVLLAVLAGGTWLLLADRADDPTLSRLPLYLGAALMPAVALAALLLARLLGLSPAAEEELRALTRSVVESAEAERLRERQTADLLRLMTAGVLVLDDRGRVTVANRGAAEVLGVDDEAALLGRPLVHSMRSLPFAPLADQALTEGRTIRRAVELTSGRIILAEAIPLRHLDPKTARVLFFLRDETAQFRTDQMRRDFVANVSHELKTPLAGLSLLASTLQHAVDEDPAQAKAFAARTSKEIDRLSDLVDDLLTLSRLEDDEAEFRDGELVDLAGLVRSIALELAHLAERERLDLQVDAEDQVLVAGDRVLLETATRNLLENALRYTDPEGNVWLHVSKTEDEALLTVTDDGLGIPRDQQDRIFERFYRVDRARSRDTGGTGLGLSIVRHIVELHQGRVEVESAVGVGSSFTVHLPLATATNDTLDRSSRLDA